MPKNIYIFCDYTLWCTNKKLVNLDVPRTKLETNYYLESLYERQKMDERKDLYEIENLIRVHKDSNMQAIQPKVFKSIIQEIQNNGDIIALDSSLKFTTGRLKEFFKNTYDLDIDDSFIFLNENIHSVLSHLKSKFHDEVPKIVLISRDRKLQNLQNVKFIYADTSTRDKTNGTQYIKDINKEIESRKSELQLENKKHILEKKDKEPCKPKIPQSDESETSNFIEQKETTSIELDETQLDQPQNKTTAHPPPQIVIHQHLSSGPSSNNSNPNTNEVSDNSYYPFYLYGTAAFATGAIVAFACLKR